VDDRVLIEVVPNRPSDCLPTNGKKSRRICLAQPAIPGAALTGVKRRRRRGHQDHGRSRHDARRHLAAPNAAGGTKSGMPHSVECRRR
jgi:hypothetical protein